MLMEVTDALTEALRPLTFSSPVTHVYNPMVYARASYARYVERYGAPKKEAVFVGMNPGPWGMTQTGVPFGSIPFVRDWMKIVEPVGRPERVHPKRPIEGYDCAKVEVSGARLWGWVKSHFETASCFAERFFVCSYCPLVFMAESGRNVTPDKLQRVSRDALHALCDAALRRTIEYLQPSYVIGIGVYATKRAQASLNGLEGVTVGRVLHPSPASPAANRGWGEAVTKELRVLGLEIPGEGELTPGS